MLPFFITLNYLLVYVRPAHTMIIHICTIKSTTTKILVWMNKTPFFFNYLERMFYYHFQSSNVNLVANDGETLS